MGPRSEERGEGRPEGRKPKLRQPRLHGAALRGARRDLAKDARSCQIGEPLNVGHALRERGEWRLSQNDWRALKLQMGPRSESAEKDLAEFLGRPPIVASMGPRSRERGETAAEAYVQGNRKALQWGRAPRSAEGVGLRLCGHTEEHGFKMGPRSEERREGVMVASASATTERLQMGPRLRGRGEGIQKVDICRGLRAQMGPRFRGARRDSESGMFGARVC